MKQQPLRTVLQELVEKYVYKFFVCLFFSPADKNQTKHQTNIEKEYTNIRKLGVSKALCTPKLHLLYLIKNTVKTVILWNIITIWNHYFLFHLFQNVIMPCKCKSLFVSISILFNLNDLFHLNPTLSALEYYILYNWISLIQKVH